MLYRKKEIYLLRRQPFLSVPTPCSLREKYSNAKTVFYKSLEILRIYIYILLALFFGGINVPWLIGDPSLQLYMQNRSDHLMVENTSWQQKVTDLTFLHVKLLNQQFVCQMNLYVETGIWILIGSLLGVVILILITSWHLLKGRRHQSDDTPVEDEGMYNMLLP